MADETCEFSWRHAGYQIWATFVVNSLTIHAGVNMAFATILLPQVVVVGVSNDLLNATDGFLNLNSTSNDSQDVLTITKDEASWIASIVAVMTPIGSIASGFLMDRFGRKKICFLTAASLALAWSLMAATTSHIYFLYSARSLAGIGAGLSTSSTVYISEITHSSIRPILLATLSAFVSFGILVATLLGSVLPWRGVAIACAVLAALGFACITTIPESPIWLCLNDQDEKKLNNSLHWLYRNEQLCSEELVRLRAREVAQPLLESPRPEIKESKSNVWKPLLLLIILFTFQQLTGGYVIIFYAIQIFESVGSMALDSWLCLIILGAIRFVMAIAAVFIVVGRKTLLLASGLGMAATMLIAGLILHLDSASIAPAICVLGFVSFSSFGYLNIPWTLNSELLPHKVRGWGSGAIVSYAYFAMFLTIKSYLYVEAAIGIANIFLIFSVLSFVAVLFVHFYIPETLGRTFEEIEKSF